MSLSTMFDHRGIDLFGAIPEWTSYFKQVPLIQASTAYKAEVIGDKMTLTLDVPGSKAPDIEIAVDGQTISIKSKRDVKRFDICEDFDTSAASAEVEHGVLTITFPKRQERKGTRIAVTQK